MQSYTYDPETDVRLPMLPDNTHFKFEISLIDDCCGHPFLKMYRVSITRVIHGAVNVEVFYVLTQVLHGRMGPSPHIIEAEYSYGYHSGHGPRLKSLTARTVTEWLHPSVARPDQRLATALREAIVAKVQEFIDKSPQ